MKIEGVKSMKLAKLIMVPDGGVHLYQCQLDAVTTAVQNQTEVEFTHNGKLYRTKFSEIMECCIGGLAE